MSSAEAGVVEVSCFAVCPISVSVAGDMSWMLSIDIPLPSQ